ncbi:MAG: pseudouridylate synthase [Betaproteobacteria bacterium]|nr:pseudouridylate synthase [Betaproteobacteria bacterium]
MLTILYRDQHLVAIDKPAGLLVHRSNIDRRETRFAVQLLRDQIGCRVQPVHRLDKGTSGVLLFALDPECTRRLGAQFERNEVGKDYLAVVRGWPPEAGCIDHPLSRTHDDYGAAPGARASLPARTDYRRLATVELPHAVDRYPTARYALLALTPHTGRRHQLRRHLKHLAHPIVGDATYGKGSHNRFFQRQFACHRLLLACVRLRLRHPVTGVELSVRAPVGVELARLFDALGWTDAVARQGAA